jgi:hypothetical protein
MAFCLTYLLQHPFLLEYVLYLQHGELLLFKVHTSTVVPSAGSN